MDIEETKKLIKNKIESENLVKKVRDVIKTTNWQKQDSREGFKESFKPLIESQEKVSENINKQQKETLEKLEANQKALTEGILNNQLALTEGLRRLALGDGEIGGDGDKDKGGDGDGEIGGDGDKDKGGDGDGDKKKFEKQTDASKITFNLEKDFTEDELKDLSKLDLVRPKNILSLSDSSIDFLINKSNNLIKTFNGKRGSLSRTINISEKEKEEKLEKIYHLQNLAMKYKKIISNFKQSRYNFQLGKGIYYNNPYQLIDRLELLTGSLLAGNNGVIPEFLNLVHILKKNKWITNEQLNSLIKSISLKWGT